MADPLTALGLASNIIQLISFASDLVSKGREIYKSANGTLVENLELETITTSLQELSSHLVPPSIPGKRSFTEVQLEELCHGCKDVSRQLLCVIQGLKASGSHMRWKSFRQALNSVWKENKIEALLKRLERYRSQIDTTLLASLREHIQSTSPSRQPMEHFSHRGPCSGQETKQWQKELIDALRRNNWQLQNKQDMAMFSSELSACTKHEREKLVKSRILERLRFNSMEDRFGGITEAHKKTFDWIFLDQENPAVPTGKHRHWSSFIEWLHGESTLYWITGKPGSGKSTLMKYLYNDDRTRYHLYRWTKRIAVVAAGFFFWNSGTAMQMSQLGLLQTLLYQAIKNDLKHVPVLFPDRWRSYELFGGDLHLWSMPELLRAFKTLISDDSKKFFFFIDGLDEFDGNAVEIANFVLEISSSRPNVKMCVASRPWLAFEDAFQRKPSLRLEDLTVSDIHLYVTDNLRRNSMFVELQRLQPRDAELLIGEVTEKASGVFLWVHLVVISLLEGLRDGDNIADLQDRLLILPSDLGELFKRILENLNPLYFKQASRLFQLVRAASEPLSLLSISFAEEGFDNAISTEIRPMPLDEILFRAETMRRRLNSRCKGLIEAPVTGSEGSEAKVQYLHRTVRDYLARSDVWEYIVSGTQNSFDPDIALCGAFLLHVKTVTPSFEILDSFWTSFKNCIEYALRFEGRAKDLHITVLNELERVGDHLFETPYPTGGSWFQDICRQKCPFNVAKIPHWTDTAPTKPGLEGGTQCFFDYAFRYPLYSYLENRLDEGYPLNSRIGGHSMLYIAALPRDIQMTKFLLRHGANPNLRESHQISWTPWHYVLWKAEEDNFSFRSGSNPVRWVEIMQQWAEMVQLFLESNADPHITVHNVSADAIVKKAFEAWDPVQTQELLSKLSALRKTQKAQKWQSRRLKGFFKGINSGK